MYITKNDYEKIIHFINSTPSTSSNFSKKIQIYLSDLFDFNHSLFWLADKKSNMYNLDFFNHKDKLIWDYTEEYADQDLQHPKKQLTNLMNNQRTVLKINETVTTKSLTDSEYYHFAQKHNMIDQMVLYFINDKSIYGGIGFSRFNGEKPFAKKDKEILLILSTHLQQSVENSLIQKEIKAKNFFFNRDKEVDLGIIQVNTNQNITFYNDNAQKIIDTISPNASVEDFFQTSIRKYISTKGNPTNINFNDWKIEIVPQKTANQNPKSQKYSIYLYLQSKKESNLHFKDLLSKREVEIFDLVLKGFTNEQISDELYISINTVKKHLRNMYEKLGVSNRTSLIYKIKEKGKIEV